MLSGVLGFLVALCPLVIVHEFGHFLFARLFGVKAEAFSVGFGPILAKKMWGETEFRLSAIPLGGYVKLLGDDPDRKLSPEEEARSLPKAKRWHRFWIFSGGPLFNFLFAILLFMAILVIGEPKVASVVGRVVQGSYAEESGFVSGDRVVSINGEPIQHFNSLILKVNSHPGVPLKFDIQRGPDKQPVQLTVTPERQDGFTIYGEQKEVGEIRGLVPYPLQTEVGISNPRSAAAKKGIETGDRIVQLGGQRVETWDQVVKAYGQVGLGQPVEIIVTRGKNPAREFEFIKPTRSRAIGPDLGLYSTELFVQEAVKESPAAEAGLQKGDRLDSIGKVPLGSFYQLKDLIQDKGKAKEKVILNYEREGKMMAATITPQSTQSRDPALNKLMNYTIGVVPIMSMGAASMIVQRMFNPFMLLYEATRRTVVFLGRNLISIGKMFTGDVSVATLGGPILIGKIAGDSLQRGLISFLNIMAILSIGLGLLNILPIPVLDGGHILLLGIEALRDRPLSLRQMEMFQQVGLSLILLLMVVVFKNDLSRLAIFN